jgi:hypothetical protein
MTHTFTDATDEDVLKLAKDIEQRRTSEYVKQGEVVAKRIADHGKPFTDDELRYAARSRCSGCKAGLAYPLGIGIQGAWYCSDWLTGRNDARTTGKHDQFPFTFYEIKSETQPSAHGATTRPEATS